MSTESFDLIAIGGGTAGLVTAAGGAGLGAKVALIERDRLGGECLWNGCVPSKALIAAARAAHGARAADRLGVTTGRVDVNLAEALTRVRAVQGAIAPHDSPERFRKLGVDVVHGTATFVDAMTVDIDGRRLTARNIVLATGTRPAVPAIPGLDTVPFHTNETIFALGALPRTLLVIGAGAIGVELAQTFARFGSAVHLVEAMPTFLPREDGEVAERLRTQLEAEGIRIHLGARATRVRADASTTCLTLAFGDGRTIELSGDTILVSAGRRANVEGLGLEAIGVQTDAGGVVTDSRLRTAVRGVFAAGDVVSGGPKFTHMADAMARTVLRNALFPGSSAMDYSAVPWVTFSDPELAHVGLTEGEARERHGGGVEVWRREVGAVDRVIADDGPPGLVKIVTDRKGRVLGGHILASHAGEMISELTIAVKLGLTVAQLAGVIHPYPTTAEAIRQAAEQRLKSRFGGWKKALVGWVVNRV